MSEIRAFSCARFNVLGFTRRERQVARHLLHGWEVPRIARELGISTGTVKSYCTSLYNRTGQSSAIECVLFLLWHPAAMAEVMEVSDVR